MEKVWIKNVFCILKNCLYLLNDPRTTDQYNPQNNHNPHLWIRRCIKTWLVSFLDVIDSQFNLRIKICSSLNPDTLSKHFWKLSSLQMKIFGLFSLFYGISTSWVEVKSFIILFSDCENAYGSRKDPCLYQNSYYTLTGWINFFIWCNSQN